VSDHDNLAIVQGIYAAFGRGDIAAIVARLDDDVRWRVNGPARIPYAGEVRGPHAVGGWFATLGGAAEIARFEPRTYIADRDHVVVLGSEDGRARTTSRGWTTAWAHVWTLRDGRVTGFEEFCDSAAVAAAFG
jgi:uncharacterized protein